MKSIITPLIFIFLVVSSPIQAEETIGIVLMHGKGSTSKSRSPIGVLARFLEDKGILVASPDMPWSRGRMLGKSYEESMVEIDEAVNELKDRGATLIVVGGHSMGANAALGYGARREGIAGIAAIAPGHIPESDGYQSRIDNDWKRAKKMVDEGKGDESGEFNDMNQGQTSQIDVSAANYLSWFDPNGPAVMPKNAAALKPGTALLWIIGENDRMNERGEEYAFNKAPSNANNAYIVVSGGHKATPKKGKKKILNWLRSL